MDNPEKLATQGTLYEDKQNKNTTQYEGADSKKGGGRKGDGRWENEEREVGGRGWEVGEEKFAKWEKT